MNLALCLEVTRGLRRRHSLCFDHGETGSNIHVPVKASKSK